jgi:hypothetical protein
MLSFDYGTPIAKVKDGRYKHEIIGIESQDQNKGRKKGLIGVEFINKGKLMPLMNVEDRAVEYIAGPSGSGKTSMAVQLINSYLKAYPKKDFYIFSRTNWKDDPAFKKLKKKPLQVPIDESLLTFEIDITTEMAKSIVLFDDITTIQDQKLKKKIESIICDVLEVGRKLDINIVFTNHLVIPNEKAFARTIMNELKMLTVFPKSGSAQQIRYVLRTYFGMMNQQIDKVLSLPSRWVRISRTFPNYVMYDDGVYIL